MAGTAIMLGKDPSGEFIPIAVDANGAPVAAAGPITQPAKLLAKTVAFAMASQLTVPQRAALGVTPASVTALFNQIKAEYNF